jgi:hypothetical protein
MNHSWTPQETNTHQDHVIAHVIDATVLGYFVFDEILHLLLDIGFVWNIFLNGEMGLLPHPVAVSELEIDSRRKELIKDDVAALLAGKGELQLWSKVDCHIKEVTLFLCDGRQLIVIDGEPQPLLVEASETGRTIEVRTQ